MFYGLAHYKNSNGEVKHIIIRNLKSTDRLGAERESRRIARNLGYIFDGIHLARNHRQKQGEIKKNFSLPIERERALAFAAAGRWIR